MNGPLRLEESFRVRSYEVQPDGQLRLVVLARMLQETAWLHARALGKGFAERESGALFWVLSRLRVFMDRYPLWGDEFTIRTWPVGTEKLLALREFVLVDAQGVLGRALSGWLVVDGSSGRPVRPEKLLDDIVTSPGEFDADMTRLPALPHEDFPEDAGNTVEVVKPHDIDQYQHVNNAAYLEWMTDALTRSHNRGTVTAFSMDFLRELTLGDRYRNRVAEHNNRSRCEVIRADDTEPVCRAELIWKE